MSSTSNTGDVDDVRRTVLSLSAAQGMYRRGEIVQLCDLLNQRSADLGVDPEGSDWLALRGMAEYDLGNVIDSMGYFKTALEFSRGNQATHRFQIAFASFIRSADFQSADETLPVLGQLRQLAASVGSASTLAGLHLAVARLEGCRGHCLSANRHLEIARRLDAHSSDKSFGLLIDLVEATLESIAGNLTRSRLLAECCFEQASAAGLERYRSSAAVILCHNSILSGDLPRAKVLLDFTLRRQGEMEFVALASLDNLAQLRVSGR